MKRKKRAKRGIESLERQIELHKKKQESAIDSGNDELFEYYKKEMQKFESEIKKKKRILK